MIAWLHFFFVFVMISQFACSMFCYVSFLFFTFVFHIVSSTALATRKEVNEKTWHFRSAGLTSLFGVYAGLIQTFFFWGGFLERPPILGTPGQIYWSVVDFWSDTQWIWGSGIFETYPQMCLACHEQALKNQSNLDYI